jgi:serine/threonine-protein kinase
VPTESDRWRRIEPAFDALLLAAPDSRDRLLDELTASDAELRSELASLLAAHEAAGEFLETPAPIIAASFLRDADGGAPSEWTGQLVGHYRLLEPIGRGGMGTVWLAERADGQFEQRVALKLIKRGMDTDEILGRFIRERQIMARLEHPNIARLLDGGVSADGRPYFVMEYVAGVSITTYCAERALSIDERLSLFETVCRAVQYAHRSLVVHRDLKPSNILVTADGEVKLLDFGIAKLLRDDVDEGTVTGWSRPFTPEYATPEQLMGEPITTSSDVYQLGLVLYESLTGRRPFHVDRRDPDRARHAVQHVEPEKPSTLLRPLRGDVDAIVLTALRKEPERRYASAEAMADDIRRHRAGRPITVRVDSTPYRIAKFARRNRGRLATALAFLVVAVGFATTYTFRLRAERDRALREAAKAGRAAEFFGRFFEGWNPDAVHAGQVTTASLLDDAVRRAEREFQNQPEIQSAMLSLAGGFFTAIGRYDRADSLLSRALRTQRQLYRNDNADLAATLTRRGRWLTIVGRFDEAERTLREALRMNRALFGEGHPEPLRSQAEWGDLLNLTDRAKEAEGIFREILALSHDSSGSGTLFRAEVSSRLGYSLYQQAKYQDGIALLEGALAEQRRFLGDVHDKTLWTIRALASAVRDIGQLDRAELLYREAARTSRLLYGDDHLQTETSDYVLMLCLHREGKLAEAEAIARRGIPRLQRVYGDHHPGTAAWRGRLGAILLDRGVVDEAEVLLRSALDDFRTSFPKGNQDEMDWANRLAYIMKRRGTPGAAEMYRTALALRARKPVDQPDYVTDGIHFLAWTMNQFGDVDEAERVYHSAHDMYTRLLPPNHPDITFTERGLAEIDVRRGARYEATRR